MRISSINNINYTKNRNFTGLWAKTTLNSDVDPALGILKVQETSYYYPFKDENLKVASVFVEGNKYAHIEGYVQKGQMVKGSQVTALVLDQ